MVAALSVATGIAPMDLLDPALPPGFLDLMIDHYEQMNKPQE